MKKMFFVLLSVIMISTVSCNNKTAEEPQKIKICFPGGAPALSIAKLAVEEPTIGENTTIEYEFLNTPDLLASKVLKEEADIAIVPSNLAAQAYNKDIPYKLIGTSVWGTLHLISTQDIVSFNDLKDKEIYSFGKDLTPDLVFKYVLTQNGINTDEDLTITYLSAASEVGPVFLSGKTRLAVLSEPISTNVLMKDEEAKIIFDFNDEWSKLTGNEKGYPQASLIIKADLIENNRDFVEGFIEEYKKSQEWAKANPEELGNYAEQMEIGMKKPMVVNGVDRMNIGPLNTEDGIEAYETYYNILLEYAPQVIGGKLPDEGFYFRR